MAGEAPEDERKLFVGGLPNETKHEDIKQHFGTFGKVEKVKLMSDQATGRFKGFGFVVFEEVAAYSAALADPEQTILGTKATVKRATTKVKQGKIYIGKLPTENCSEDEIRAHFEQFGLVVDVVRPVDKAKDDELKPFAFVTFEREDIARQLVKLGEDVMLGHKFSIKPVITKERPLDRPGPRSDGLLGGGPARSGQPVPAAWAAQPAYGYGGHQAFPGYGQADGAAAYQGYGAGYGGQGQPAAGYGYGSGPGPAAPATAAPPTPVAPGTGVPSLATFNPYDISSYGGGKAVGAAVPGAAARHQPY